MYKNSGIHIKVVNFEKSKLFYESLGFKKVFEYGPDQKVNEEYRGVTFLVGKMKLEIANGHRAVKDIVFKEKILSSKVSLMVEVEKLSKIVNLCRNIGINLAVEPRHYYWGTLEVVVKDPDGLVIVFVAPYSSREAKILNANSKFAVKP